MRARNISLLAGALALAGLPACRYFGGGSETNVVLLVVGSLRYDAISDAPGAASTPNLHALAAEGVSFRSCFGHTPLSRPALGSLLSSRLPHEHGLLDDGSQPSEDIELLPEWLTRRGYQTFAALGLPGQGQSPAARALERGFSEVATFPHELASADEILGSFETFLDTARPDDPWFGLLQFSETCPPFDAAEDSGPEALIVRDGAEPETLAIGAGSAWEQTAVLAPGRTRFTLRSAAPMRVLRFGARAGKRALKIVFERGEPLVAGKDFVLSVENPDGEPLECTLSGRFHDAPTLAEGRKRYRGEIEAVDRAVGLLVERLRARGAYDNTLIVVTSDHGLALGEHGNLGRGELLFDEFLHVPLLIKPVKGDERVEQLAQSAADVTRLLDVVPTLLELADVRAMPGAGGGSLLEHRRRELIAEIRTAGAACSSFAIRDERFKLVLGGDNFFEMYDLCSDTLEQENVFPLQGHNKLEWQRRLGALVSSTQAPQGAEPGARLEALGY